ncbi:MAG TPA: 3-oxoadipate enol-lactonase [Xanthobacteraceae bacterium]|nr:3-oxoadipate enol-lactonase [Xanthobacteraceae bacterium]
MPTIDADGCPINVEIEGPERAPVLVFSNSLGTNLHMWDEQAKHLVKKFRVVRYDQRGHGKSGAPDTPYTLERLGRDVLAILDGLRIERAHFCGLSMGGFTGMWLGRLAPQRIDKLILSNTAAKIGDPVIWNGRIQTVRSKGMAAIVDSVLERWFTKTFREKSAAAVARVREMLMTTPPQGYAGCSAAIRDMDQRWDIGAIKLPTLVIAGAHDPATTVKDAELIVSQIKGSKFIKLDAAHLSNIEQGKQYTDTIEKFLG